MWARPWKVSQEFYVLAYAPANEWEASDHVELDQEKIASGDGWAEPGELAPEPENDDD